MEFANWLISKLANGNKAMFWDLLCDELEYVMNSYFGCFCDTFILEKLEVEGRFSTKEN